MVLAALAFVPQVALPILYVPHLSGPAGELSLIG